jgi:hypothetical protein
MTRSRYAKYSDHPLYPWPELRGVPLDEPPPASVAAASALAAVVAPGRL